MTRVEIEYHRRRARRAMEIGWPALIAEEDAMAARIHPAPWPRIVLAVTRLRRPGDRGVGDTVHRLLEPLGGRVFERWYERVMGRPCGCQDRLTRLNAEFPYDR